MNSNKALLMRESIKFSPKIRAVLRMIWIAADWDGSNSIDYIEYKKLNKKLQLAVLGHYMGAWLCERDWKVDCQGQHTLNFGRFTLSWFQLADTWTEEISEQA